MSVSLDPIASPAARDSKTPTPWGLVLLLGALTAMGPMAIDMYLPAIPAMGEGLHATPGQTQATVTAFLGGMAVGQMIYGPASDRLGRRMPIIAGIFIYTIASALCAMATSAPLLIACRVIQALGACAGGVVARAVVRDRFGHVETARMLSLLALVMGLAPICAPLIGGAFLKFGGWRANFWLMTGFGLMIGVAGFAWMKESLSREAVIRARAENPVASYWALLCNPRILGYALTGGLNGAAIFTYVAAAPDLLIRTYKIPAAQFGWVFGLNAAGLISAGQINRYLLRRMHPDVVLLRSSIVAIVAALGLTICAITGFGDKWTVLFFIFMLVCTFGFMQGNTIAGALSIDALRAGSTSALMGAATFGAGALVSGAVALFHDGTARPMGISMLISMIGSALTLRFMALPRRETTRAAGPLT